MSIEMRIAFDSYTDILLLSKLKKSKFQRNKHPQDQIERLAKIMLAHGVRHPIHISKLSGQVCFGHGRWEAAKLNGWDKYPVVYQDFKDEDEEYSCVQSDNAIARWSELDLSLINSDLKNLDGANFDLDLLGIRGFVVEPAELNVNEEWAGMPEFIQQDKTAYRAIVVNFKSERAIKKFAEAIGQSLTDKTRSIWFPKAEIDRLMDKRYSAKKK